MLSQFKRYAQSIGVVGVGFEYLSIHITVSKAYIHNHKLTLCFTYQLFTTFSRLDNSLVFLVSL